MDNQDLAKALAAIVLSFIVLIGYQYYFTEPAPKVEQQKEVSEQRPVEPDATVAQVETKAKDRDEMPLEVTSPGTEEIVKVETPLYSAEISSKGGVIKSWILKTYDDDEGSPIVLGKSKIDIFPLSLSKDDEFDSARLDFVVTGSDLNLNENKPEGSLSFLHRSEAGNIKRTLTFHAGSYRVDVFDEVSGYGNYWVALGEDFGLTGAEGFYSHIGPVTLMGTDREEYKTEKIKGPSYVTPVDLKWVALEDKYFFSGIVPRSEISSVKVWRKENSGLIALKMPEGKNEYVVYAGPKVIDELKTLGLQLEHIVDFGFWSFLARPIFWLLIYINNIIGNFGWSIIILTILIRIPFIPLLNKGQASMKRMQALQPKMKEVKEKYKKDSQKMQKEMMELYKKHKVNPMGGCLPMLVQIPVFFALYKVLLVAIEMRQSPWILWIHDLSAKDPYYVLPIVMGATMFLQQKMTPTSADPKQAKIMMFMPIIFTFMFLNFSSGLVLYWLMSNVLSIIQQYFVNKKVTAEAQKAAA
jgi:YidC/Oxa1 family membrane protein insertase